MSVVWSGVTESGAVVPVQVDGLGRVIATTGEPPGPPVINYNGASAWGAISADGTVEGGLNVETVRRPGTGTYSVVFASPMPDGSYSVVTNSSNSYGTTASFGNTSGGFTVTIRSTANNNELVDSSFCFAVHSINALPPKGGTGTDSWASVQSDGTVAGSFNVASVKESKTGVFDVVFTTPMPSSNYSVVANSVNRAVGVDAGSQSPTGFALVVQQVPTGANASIAPGYTLDFQVNATNATLPVTYTSEQLDAVINNWRKTGDTLSTDDAVEMNGPVRLAGGKAGFTDEGQIYFTPGPGPQKYLLEVQEGQMQLKRIDSAY